MSEQPDDLTGPRPSAAPADGGLRVAIPGLARIALAAWWRTTGWAAESSVRVGSRVVRAAVSGESPAQLFRSASGDLRRYARAMLDLDSGGSAPGFEQESVRGHASRSDNGREATGSSLRDRGADLLRRSADVNFEEDAHPAYGRILGELAPDEGRILRLLALEGPQPSVDVRSGPRALNVVSELVAPGLSMIGAEAGCRYAGRVPAYLNNLYRLGLVWFSRESVKDPLRYQVLEAQPDVIAAMHETGRAHTIRRSIYLTPFGEDFCRRCLPIDTIDDVPNGLADDGASGDVAVADAEPAAEPD